jgi:toxin-antitoxin system PIN domain toxin
MSRTLDVNVLVYAADETSDHHSRARALLDHVAMSPSITYLLWPVLLGYVRIITHPSILQSPLSPEAAIADIDDLVSRPQIIVIGEGDGFWETFKRVAQSAAPRGNLVPDAHLVALMAENGVSTIWTGDRDFRRFSGITVKDPFDERYSAGFE